MNIWWAVQYVVIPLLFGGLSGFTNYVVITKKLKGFRKLDNGFTLGFWAHVLAGSLAGIAAVNLITPDGTFGQAIAIAILAGYNGTGWLLQNALASQEKAKKKLGEQLDLILKMENDDSNE